MGLALDAIRVGSHDAYVLRQQLAIATADFDVHSSVLPSRYNNKDGIVNESLFQSIVHNNLPVDPRQGLRPRHRTYAVSQSLVNPRSDLIIAPDCHRNLLSPSLSLRPAQPWSASLN